MLIQIAQFLLGLSLLIVIHEFGHFLPGKYFGIKVSKFYLFFDYKFSLLKKQIGETEWGIGWIPLGGYVKIEGMIDESMDTENLSDSESRNSVLNLLGSALLSDWWCLHELLTAYFYPCFPYSWGMARIICQTTLWSMGFGPMK